MPVYRRRITRPRAVRVRRVRPYAGRFARSIPRRIGTIPRSMPRIPTARMMRRLR